MFARKEKIHSYTKVKKRFYTFQDNVVNFEFLVQRVNCVSYALVL